MQQGEIIIKFFKTKKAKVYICLGYEQQEVDKIIHEELELLNKQHNLSAISKRDIKIKILDKVDEHYICIKEQDTSKLEAITKEYINDVLNSLNGFEEKSINQYRHARNISGFVIGVYNIQMYLLQNLLFNCTNYVNLAYVEEALAREIQEFRKES